MKTIRFATLALTLALGFSASLHAQVVTPNPPPTIITTQPYTITKAGYYQLGADLVSSATSGAIITIAASNVTLDFAGHYISGPSTTTTSQIYGVLASERGNLTIRNGTVAFCYQGIGLFGNGQSTSLNINQRIDNMLVSHCFYSGIQIYQGFNCIVSNCRVSFIGGSTLANLNGMYAITLGFNLEMDNLVDHCIVSNVTGTAANPNVYGIISQNATVSNSSVSRLTAGTGGTAFGYYACDFAINNVATLCSVGFMNAAKYRDNLTLNCATPFSGGLSVGANN